MKFLFLSLATLAALHSHAADLRIDVNLPADRQGQVLAALFDKGEGFPRGKPLQTAIARPVDGKARRAHRSLCERCTKPGWTSLCLLSLVHSRESNSHAEGV